MKTSNFYPLVSHIRHFSLDDGPGIRSTVFLKGCPLSCVWCHNPESIDAGVQLGFDSRHCVGCGLCEKICPRGAIALCGHPRIMRNRCDCCLKCAEECPSRAIYRIGNSYCPAVLADLLLGDRLPYQDTGSGVTFSGGEPCLHMDYLGRVMKHLKQHAVHIAVQTCGLFEIDTFKKKLLPHTDMLYFDLKLMSSQAHRRHTGRSNRRIHRNFQLLLNEPGIEVIATIPLVPGITATAENLKSIAAFLRHCGCRQYELRPYHCGGRQKRIAIGLDPLAGVPDYPFSRAMLPDIQSWFQSLLDGKSHKAPHPAPIDRTRNPTAFRSELS
jgi:pyruvate formate lyase activating enzyme